MTLDMKYLMLDLRIRTYQWLAPEEFTELVKLRIHRR